MATIRVTATAGADGVVRLAVPVGEAGGEFDVVLTPKPPTPRKTPEELGWPGYIQKTYGAIDDDTFVAPPRLSMPRPVAPRAGERHSSAGNSGAE